MNRIARTALCLLPASALVLSACSSSKSGGSSEGIPKTIHVTLLTDKTGAAAYVGEADQNGLNLAVKSINDTGMLGKGVKIAVDVKDTTTTPATAAALMPSIAQSDSVAVFGPGVSSEALAAAPIAQRDKLPYISIQSNVESLMSVGDYIYRLTAPSQTYTNLPADYLKAQGVKSVAIVYNNDEPSNSDLGTKWLPGFLKTDGISVTDSVGVPTTATDLTSVVTKMLGAKADAVAFFLLGSQISAFVSGMRNAGFKGDLVGSAAVTPAILKPAGQAADGVIYPHDYSPGMTSPASAVAFTKAYKAEYGSDPLSYAANAYDAMMFFAKSVKASGSATRAGVLKGMQTVSNSGSIDGACGTLTFTAPDNRDVKAPGVLLQYSAATGTEKIIQTGTSS